MHTTYPTNTDLDAFLTAANLATTNLNLQAACDAAAAEFERGTGRKPFIASNATTRLFDPPTGPNLMLDLGDDLAVLTGLAINGQAQMAGQDFWLRPYNADAAGQPFSVVEFSAYKWPLRWNVALPQWKQSIAVMGQWGYSTSLPDDAWQGVLQGAAHHVYTQLALQASGGLHDAEVGDIKVTFSRGPGASTLEAEATNWQATFQAAIALYRRVAV